MAILFKNNAASTLTYKMTDVQEVMYVADASVFPVITPDSGDVFRLTLVGENTLEIVEAFEVYNPEGRQGFKIRRAQEGTTAQAWPAGTRVEMRITADALNSFVPTAVQLAKDYVDATGVASTTNVGFAGVDGETTQADAEGVITVKDVAINGNLEDLASARGQIGNNIRINTASDLNAYTKAGNWLFSDAAAVENFPNIGRGGLLNCYVSTTAIFQFFTEFNNNRRYIRYGIPNSTWTNWIQFISVAQLGDGIRNTNGIISVPEYDGATASTAGTAGLVPPAAAGEQESFLTGGGEYKPALSTKGGSLTGSVQINDTANVISTAPAANSDHGLFVADKNGAIKGGFDSIQRSYDNAKWTQLFSKASGGTIASLGVVAYEDGTGEVITYNPLLLNTTQLKEIIDNGNRVFILSGDRSKPGYTFRFSPDTGEVYMDGRAIHAKADSAVRADTAGSADYATQAGALHIAGGPVTFNWLGQGDQPEWLWGGNEATRRQMYVYNPANFSVNYANSAGSAPANGGTSWATTVTPNVSVGDANQAVPAGGTWTYIVSRNGAGRIGTIAGGTVINQGMWLAIRVA
jgi:hypothetical protein